MKSKNLSEKILRSVKSKGFKYIELPSVVETNHIVQRSGENFRKFIFSFTDSSITGIVSFTREHNFAGIMTATIHSGGASYTNGTHLNVKVFNSATQNDSTWNGTLAKVVVGSNAVSSFEITNPGSGWVSGNKGYFDTTRIAGNGVAILDGSVSGAGLTAGNIGVSTDLVLQFTGIGVTIKQQSLMYFTGIGT